MRIEYLFGEGQRTANSASGKLDSAGCAGINPLDEIEIEDHGENLQCLCRVKKMGIIYAEQNNGATRIGIVAQMRGFCYFIES
jgi:hypothetical protein